MVSQSLHLSRPRSLVVEEIRPLISRQLGRGTWFLDFGRAAFGTVRLTLDAREAVKATVHLGEKLEAGRIDRQPPGCVRYRAVPLELRPGMQTIRVSIPPDQRNTGPAAIQMPELLFEVLPFRYVELIVDGDAAVELHDAHQLGVFYPFNESASAFHCDDDRLNRVWELCKYSIKATSFCGTYVDGDRERIPYEGDAYVNQLCHYGVDAEYEMARHTLEYLLFHPTWATDWSLHCLPMAWTDYEYTGRTDLLAAYYEVLQRKSLLELAREDGLISTMTGGVTQSILAGIFLRHPGTLRDIVDWPPPSPAHGVPGEIDDYDMAAPIKTVINAFHAWNLDLLARTASVLEKPEDAAFYRNRYRMVVTNLQRRCFRSEKGVFTDGEGSEHVSLHANMVPAALGLAPAGREADVMAYALSRGMACSVYGAMYLLEACYRFGHADYALDLMTAEHDRGWLNMLRAGSTVTMEAWDLRYKFNLDWNHAWGAAPANIIPRFLAGVRPALPGFAEVAIAPQPGRLQNVDATVPTPHGPVRVQIGSRWLRIDTPVPAQLDASGLGRPSSTAVRLSAGQHEIGLHGKRQALTSGAPRERILGAIGRQ